jgi:hypothetical protein
MFLTFPKSAGFLFNLIALIICFSIYLVMKRYGKQR